MPVAAMTIKAAALPAHNFLAWMCLRNQCIIFLNYTSDSHFVLPCILHIYCPMKMVALCVAMRQFYVEVYECASSWLFTQGNDKKY